LLRFAAVPSGDYKVDYQYKSERYTQAISADASGVSSDDAVKTEEANVNYFVNVDKLTSVDESKTAAGGRSPLFWILTGLGLALLVVAIIIIRRRSAAAPQEYIEDYNDLPPAIPPEYIPPASGEGSAVPETLVPSDAAIPLNTPPLPVPLPPSPAGEPVVATVSDAELAIETGADNNDIEEHKHNKLFKSKDEAPQEIPEHMGESLKTMVLRSMQEEARKRQEQARTDKSDDRH